MTPKTVTIHKAQGTSRGADVPSVQIILAESLPSLPPRSGESMQSLFRRYDRQFYNEARRLLAALKSCLPGGTYDRLFALMAKDKASFLDVPQAGDEVEQQ